MGRKRKYARWGEDYEKEECTKCKWQGNHNEKNLKKLMNTCRNMCVRDVGTKIFTDY